MKVIVLGGGLSGLAAGYTLVKKGFKTWNISSCKVVEEKWE
jgi:protoporphyrinogen oxidase